MKLSDIVKAIARQHERMRILDIVCKQEQQQIKEEIKRLQEKCPHPKWQHHPDASGNNDSWNECEVCGYEE